MSNTSSLPDMPAEAEITHGASETTAVEAEAAGPTKADMPLAGHIHDVALLDLRSARTPEDLNGITAISEVGCILVPKALAIRLAQIPMKEVGAVIPVPSDDNIVCQMGQVWLTGEALAAGDPGSILLIIGQAFLKTVVTAVGYKEIHLHGQIMAPRGSEGPLGAKLTEMHGQVLYIPAEARTLMGEETIGREFLELLPKPQCLVVMGELTFADDVTVDLLKAKVPEIVLMGEIHAPRALLPLVQVLTVEKMGEIHAKA